MKLMMKQMIWNKKRHDTQH